MKKILLTGASGFIGKQLLQRLLKLNYEVAVVSRKSTFFSSNVQFYSLNLENKSNLLKVFIDFKPNIVIHNAAQPRMSEPLLDISSNIVPSLQLIEMSCDFAVEKFIFASSGGAIYGEIPSPHKANVADRVYPHNSYGLGKLTVENYLYLYRKLKGLNFNILRYANVIGRFNLSDDLDYIIPKLVSQVHNKLPLKILGRDKLGDSGYIRDYISVDDIIKANLLCIDNSINEEIINVCSGKAISVFEIANMINNFLGNPSEIQFLEPRAGMVKRSVLDPIPLERYLTPIKFEMALEDVLNNL